MSIPVSLRGDFKASQLRGLARKTIRANSRVPDPMDHLVYAIYGAACVLNMAVWIWLLEAGISWLIGG